MLDGFDVGHLPPGIGAPPSDFSYEWRDVRLTSRVWEREVDGGHRVDLQVIVLCGPGLTSATALRDFLVDYHERDPATWALTEFRHGHGRGFIGQAEAFWLVEPGVAVEVRIAPDRFGMDELRATALGVRPCRPEPGGDRGQ